jgi:transposase
MSDKMGFEEIPVDIKYDAVIMNAKGVPLDEVATALGISDSTIKRAKRNLKVEGQIEHEKKKPGPKRTLTPALEDVCSVQLSCIC